MRRIGIIVLILLNTSLVSTGQASKIDSLKQVLKSQKRDTTYVKTLYALSRIYSREGDYISGIKYAQQSTALADSLGFVSGSAKGNVAAGIAYYHLGKFPEALRNDLDALKKYESIDATLGIGDALNLVGNVYYDQRDYKNAMSYYMQAEACFKKIKNKQRMAGAMTNIANVYNGLGEYKKAIVIYDSILVLQKDLKNLFGENDCYMSLGNAFKGLELYDSSLMYFSKAVHFYEKKSNKERLALAYGSTAEVLSLMKRYVEAKDFFLRSLDLAIQIGYTEGKREVYLGLSTVDHELGDYKSALTNYKLFVAFKDSLQNEGNTKKQVQIEMQFDFDKRTAADSIRDVAQKNRDQLRQDQEIQKQQLYTFGGIGGFVLMLIVAVVSFRAFRSKQKANAIISHQKELVEEKQKEILDSIHYAKRIQKSMLPTEKFLSKNIDRIKSN